jgi:energy-coupling factor transporter ATP-binding protein EcfA2
MKIAIEPGSSAVFVGANGGGKTRLAVHIENALQFKAHRIAAHRALTLRPEVAKISEEEALAGLRTGHVKYGDNIAMRSTQRWHQNMATSLLNDFDFLVQALFADQSRKSLITHKKARAGDFGPAEPTKFELLAEVWQGLLPDRTLEISGDDIEVFIRGSGSKYSGSEMSDGERAIFYMIGQTLAAKENTLLIIDEPELHVHRSIMAKLWDELEAARQDCAFLFITHDLEFAASRSAQKFVIRDYDPTPRWAVEVVPEDTGFDEELTTLILGSRRPVLFVEGDESSLDTTIYRCCFPGWTVVSRGSCEEVIHAVVTMRRNKALTRITCSGIVDADDYDEDDIAHLGRLGIAVLPVSEIENVILLPAVSRAIAESEGYGGAELEECLTDLRTAAFDTLAAKSAVDAVVTRYCRRRIDRLLKKIDLSAAGNVADITLEYGRQTNALNIAEIAKKAEERIEGAKRANDLARLLANYDNKGLMVLAAKYLKRARLADFEGWLTRVLRNDKAPGVAAAIQDSLPKVAPE